MSESSIHMAIADKACEAERIHAKMLGYDAIQVPFMAFAAFCGVYILALEDEKPAVLTRFRPMVAK